MHHGGPAAVDLWDQKLHVLQMVRDETDVGVFKLIALDLALGWS